MTVSTLPPAPPEPSTDPRIHAALFSQDQLKAHARSLARSHAVGAAPARGLPLLPRLEESAARLEDAFQYLSAIARRDPQPVGSEDWLRDNYYVVLDQIREIRRDLPRKYYIQLPKLDAGPAAGYPRVYLLARELVTHTASRLDVETLIEFASAYQEAAPLSIGETWAIPIMLRLALVEELRWLVDRIVATRASRERARKLEVLGEAEAPWAAFDEMLQADIAAHGRLSAAYVVELLQWLRDQSSAAAPVWASLQRALEAQGDSADVLLQIEQQREAADQVAMGNAITSMRLLSAIDWPLFFDRVSVVERVLRSDPAGAYAAMDFPTRDRYRHAVEQLSRRSGHSETAVAEQVVALAGEALQGGDRPDRYIHVGYYLISGGRFGLERQLAYRPTVNERMARFFFRHPALGYLGTIALLLAAGVASLLAYADRQGGSAWQLWLVGLVVLVPVSELAISVFNALLTSRVPPRNLPKLALRDGIPAAARTIVVIPVIAESPARLAALCRELEVRFFANRDPHLHFALLNDFPDAVEPSTPADEALVEEGRRQIDQMNATYGADRFFFFQRERRWNAAEGRWMGWERKRGKLTEFNRLLRGNADTSFVVRHGDVSILTSVKYVITLDSDTQLPLDSARRMIGTISHPLIRARIDPAVQRVTEGYGVLQPRIGVSIESATRTAFAAVFAGHVGIDPYTTAVSDVYQDIFHEGSFVGKGIYDVDVFTAALAGRVPENRLLSHDLFEGAYVRTGLCTDIHLIDDYPPDYLSFAARMHRWVRGDWQIARWIWRTVPDERGRAVRNTLPAIARWKILDNLRRSLLAPSLIALLVTGWTVLPGSALTWLLLALLVLTFPAYVQLGRSLSNRYRGVPLRDHILAEHDNLITSVRQALLSIVFLLHLGWTMSDAIVRALTRLVVRKRLLEWVTADRTARERVTQRDVLRRMWGVPAAAVLIAGLVALVAPARLALALPVIVLWSLSPWLAYVTGRPVRTPHSVLKRSERETFRTIARRTWRFFDDLVRAEDQWLIPDNIQENRLETVAHRTSPTNIGLQLLSTLAAHDLGYVTATGLVSRLEPTFATLLELPRYRGHLYNWYDTRTLEPLAPAYISTVDSGNLAGYLITLGVGLDEIVERSPLVSGTLLEALRDDLALCGEEVARVLVDGDEPFARRWRTEVDALGALLDMRPEALRDWTDLLTKTREHVSTLGVLLHELEEEGSGAASAEAQPRALAEAAYWLEHAAGRIADQQDQIRRLAPSAFLGDEPGLERGPAPPPAASWTRLVLWADEVLLDLERRGGSAELRDAVTQGRHEARQLIDRAERLRALADDLAEGIEFAFLFNEERQLFSIGFGVADGRLDNAFYDTLASEARLASFVAIATGEVPPDHWFKLARSLTPTGSLRALLSWSASMFEYLMPQLVMRSYPGTLLDETYRAVVQRHVRYGLSRGVPWGISESAYHVQDLEGNYQYRAFGVPGLGLKRGLSDDLVVAPYATLLAAPVAPAAALANLQHLRKEGAAGRYGFYEAIDYTPERLPKGQTRGAVLPTYMAHHQGMSLVALDNLLNGSPMQRRFHEDPRVQAAELLLQERIPQLAPLSTPPIERAANLPTSRRTFAVPVRRYVTPHTLSPRTHLLSNGSYTVMLTNAGGGYSRRQGLALTRWREDSTTDEWGTFCYVRDLESGALWSTAYQPTRRDPDEFEVTFAPDRAVWRRRDGALEVRTEVVVSPEDDAEIRRVSISNHGDRPRSISLTSYAEVALAPADADLAHPAFSNLFVETMAVPERDAVICSRRPRKGTTRPYLVHLVSGGGKVGGATEYETDRARFVGRGRTLESPAALTVHKRLSNTTGAVLDPIVALRQAVRVPPGGTARVTFVTGFAESEPAARALIEKYHDRHAVARALALASTHAQIELRHLGLAAEETIQFQRLAGRMHYGDPRLRAHDAIQANTLGQAELWKYGISGDLPILLLHIDDGAGIPLFRELVKAHEYLRLKGFVFDFVVLNEHATSYLQDLQTALLQIVESGPEQAWVDRSGGVFLRRADLMPAADRTLLRATARAVMDAAHGRLHEQLIRQQTLLGTIPTPAPQARPAGELPTARRTAGHQPTVAADDLGLELFNGLGGFADGGREYVVRVGQDGHAPLPPAPWVNVVTNPAFGFVASETGAGCTWSGNSHDNRLTPWRNDAVRDPAGEAMFVRDEETARYWSVTPLPAGGSAPYTVRHSQGYTSYEHARDHLKSTLVLFVPVADPVKVFHLRLRNESPAPRRVSVTLYVDWVLGENRTRAAAHVVTARDPATGAILARNVFRQTFAERVAFLDLSPGEHRGITADRTEFIGRNGTLARPAALERGALSGRTGGGFDPCGAVSVSIVLGPSEERAFVGLLGDAGSQAEARDLVKRYRQREAVAAALGEVRGFWNRLLGTLEVRTPDRSMDLALNRWIPYQTLACRVWGRTAFYQSSGAFGFRDQLQDVLAFLMSAPHLARAQILRAAARQFVEGDVQHWWHEPAGNGVRTRFSDDRLWLVYATVQYVAATGDRSVLDEPVPFLEGRVLDAGEHEVYEPASVSPVIASVYEHCVRAIAVSLETGAHGLPLMGTGDWNDGMSLVGAEGRGESVWLAWFLAAVLRGFADVAASRGEADRAASYREHARALLVAIEAAWDGDWYRRAYFDDGTPLGSRENEECRIDAIAQSWAVIGGGGDPERARRAMQSAEEHLVRRHDGLVLLLTPPFDRMVPSPGYIQGYVPGVRENGGQYTHAALWTVLAFAKLGDGDKAMELFSLINPINHGRTPEEVARYRVEPYVVAADVYARPPHTGRGGWTWYTGSAGWMYRVGIEAILGISLRHGRLHLDPCIPRGWPKFEATLRTPDAEFHIVVENPEGVTRGVKTLELDGVAHDDDIALTGVRGAHRVRAVLRR